MRAFHRGRTGGWWAGRALFPHLVSGCFAGVGKGGLGENEPEGGSGLALGCAIAVAVIAGIALCAGASAFLVGGLFGVRVSTSSGSLPSPTRMLLNEYPLPHAQSQPRGITSGPDGAMWFTETGGQRIGWITADGTITEFSLPAGSGKPLDIAAGPDGNLWFTEDTGRIGRMTRTGTVTEVAPPTAGVAIGGIASGPDGNLWFTESGSVDAIGRITPAGAIIEYALPHAGSRAAAISPGHDGNLWFTEIAGNRIGRITPQGSIAEFAIPTAASDPESITAGPNGAVWFTENAVNKYARITPEGHITEYAMGSSGPLTQAKDFTSIMADRAGRLWVATKDNQLVWLRPGGGISAVVGLSTANALPYGLAASADGSLWITEPEGNAIGRLQVTGT